MTKILKKSLACLLVFVLCFTAIAGCLSVSAAAPAATFDYKTYFPNDNKVWAACAGQNVRAQLSMENLEAGASIGVSVEIPKGAEITSVDGWSVNTSCALSEVSRYFDEENSIFTIIYDVTVSGNYTLFVRYNITEEVAKKVHHMNAKFEAAFASNDEIKQITVTDYYEVFDHKVVTDEAVAPGCETTGLTEGSHCEICGEVFVAQEEVEATGHNYVDGTCANCGNPDPDAGPAIDDTLVFAGAAVGFGTSSLQVNFRIRNNLLTKYSNMELVIIPQKYDATTLNLVEDVEEIVVPYAKLAGTGTFRTYAYADIYLYELGLEIQYMLRGVDTNGNTVVSPTYSTSPANYLKTLTPSDDLMATLIADTLVAGEKAAIAFGAEGSDLAAAPSILEGFDYSAATEEFNMESCNKVDTHNATNADWGDGSTGTHRMSKSVTIGKVPYISYRIRGGSSIDLDKLSVNVTYTQITGVGTTAQYNRTFTSADTANLYKNGSFVLFKFDAIGLGDGNSDITFVATYDGAEVFNSEYSIETYFYNNMNSLSTDLQELATALLKLGSSFRAKMA